jgi:hypothetical protein
MLDMSNRNFDSRVIIQRLQNQNYARNLYRNNTNGKKIINNAQNSHADASRFTSYIPGAQTEYFKGLIGGGETISIGGIVNIPPFPRPQQSSIPTTIGGSMFFNITNPTDLAYVQYPNNGSLAIEQNDFTIEWFQYWLGLGDFPRVFSIGNYGNSNISIAVSYEGTTYFWNGMSPIAIMDQNPPTNEWTHMAIVGSGGNQIKFYMNGNLEQTIDDISYNFTDGTTQLTIGNEDTPLTSVNFTGQITNFRWVIGTQVYTSNFTPPSAPLTNIPGTQLLLLSSDSTNVLKDSSNADRIPSNNNITFSTTTPF